VQSIDFVAALAMILVSDAHREIEQRAEARLVDPAVIFAAPNGDAELPPLIERLC
jgi:hypothetical protein